MTTYAVFRTKDLNSEKVELVKDGFVRPLNAMNVVDVYRRVDRGHTYFVASSDYPL